MAGHVIPAPGMLRQEDHKFKASLGCETVSATTTEPVCARVVVQGGLSQSPVGSWICRGKLDPMQCRGEGACQHPARELLQCVEYMIEDPLVT
jgi:hypothetical protein